MNNEERSSTAKIGLVLIYSSTIGFMIVMILSSSLLNSSHQESLIPQELMLIYMLFFLHVLFFGIALPIESDGKKHKLTINKKQFLVFIAGICNMIYLIFTLILFYNILPEFPFSEQIMDYYQWFFFLPIFLGLIYFAIPLESNKEKH